jgi:hypothetical protein
MKSLGIPCKGEVMKEAIASWMEKSYALVIVWVSFVTEESM